MVPIAIKPFNMKRPPRVALIGGFAAKSGSPAVNVPAGQRYLQNAGDPMPISPLARSGIPTTKTARIIYLT
jgi:hypothetical protein